MSVDIACWKWMPGIQTPDPTKVFSCLIEDRPHPALASFDTAKFEEALRDVLAGEHEFPFAIECHAFRGQPCSSVHLNTGYDTCARYLLDVVRVAESQGLVVFESDRNQIIAIEEAEAIRRWWTTKSGENESAQGRYEIILNAYIVPVLRGLGFEQRGTSHQSADGDRVQTVTALFRDFGEPHVAVNLAIGFRSLQEFENSYHVFCGENRLQRNDPSHIFKSLPIQLQGGPVRTWSLSDGCELSVLGEEISADLKRELADLAIRFPFLQSLIPEWESRQKPPVFDLARAYWLLGEKMHALKLLDARQEVVLATLRERRHPPSSSEKIEIRFLREFLSTRA